MNDTDYIRKGVELADGWTGDGGNWITSPETFGGFADENPCLVDALAAQLRRQCRKIDKWSDILIARLDDGEDENYADYDEAMADIIDVVDSGVLE